jgi:ADP-L-glycero-D-manno-heptose 6-epimerase
MIIVTGGAGFIGSAIVWELNRRGIDDILVVDRLRDGMKWKNLAGLRYADYLDKDDFRESFCLGSLPSATEAVIHLGACSSTTERDADYLMDNNFQYTRELCSACVQVGVRFVYASSAATYGAGEHGYVDDEDGIELLRPLNMYGYSKQLFDAWAKREGLLGEIAGVKYSNVFGPNEYHKANMRSMVVQAFQQIRDCGRVRLFKSYREEYAHGEQVRDFVYVKDAVAMTLFLVDHPDINGIFNVGAGTARSWNDLAKAVFAALGKEPRIEYVEMPESLRGQYQYFTKLEMAKLRAAGYCEEVVSLEEGVADYVQNYLVPEKYLDFSA